MNPRLLPMLLVLAGCFLEGPVVVERPKPKGPPVPIVNPDYVVFRAVSETPLPDGREATVYGRTVYYREDERILDLRHLDPRTVELEDDSIVINTMPEGDPLLQNWTTAHVGQMLGIFIDGKLIAAPRIMSKISDTVVLTGDFGREEAAAIAARLRRGGA